MNDNENITKSHNPFILTGGYFTPGHADDFVKSIEDSEKRTVCESELLYYRGYANEAGEKINSLVDIKHRNTVLAALIINALSSVSGDNTENIAELIQQANDISKSELTPSLEKTAEFLSI